MSFGYSVGDIVSLVQLAWKTVQNSRKACGEHDEFTREASSLHVVIQRLEKESSKLDSPINRPGDTYKEELRRIVGGCSRVLTGLNRGLEKYNTLSKKESSAKKLLQEVVFGNGEMADMRHLREQMTYYTASLSLLVNMVSMGSIGRVERQMEKAGGDIEGIRIAIKGITARLSSINDREGSILTTYEDDDKAVWKEFRKELYQEGFSSAIIEKHKRLIKAYIKELANRGLLDDETSHDLEEISAQAGTVTRDHAIPSCEIEDFPKGPMGGYQNDDLDHWPNKPTPPQAIGEFLSRSKDSSAHDSLKAATTVFLSAAALASGRASLEEQGKSREMSIQDDYPPWLEEGYISGFQRGTASPKISFRDAKAMNDRALDGMTEDEIHLLAEAMLSMSCGSEGEADGNASQLG